MIQRNSFIWRLCILAVIIICIIILPWVTISFVSKHKIYTQVDEVPATQYGLLLGTTPISGGKQNRFFTTRIEATKELYERGKIQKIIVSGAKNNDGYNEPVYMKNALVKSGIPLEHIIMDEKGFRTIDSVVRAHQIFKVPSVIVISQPFHIERALFLADMRGIDMIGFGAADVPLSQGIGTYIREVGARWKAMFDVIVRY